MRPRHPALAFLLLALAGCASRATMDARYDASLQRWHGVARAELVAGWGRPLLASSADGVETLTYEVRDDIANGGSLPAYSNNATVGAPTVSVTTVAPRVPMRCITRFELRAGVVTSWTFEGLLCGAPT